MIPAICHVHSTWSYDGKWTLPDLAALFAERGTRILLLSDHDRGFDPARWRAHRDACRAASTNGITIVPGMEYSDVANRVHVLVWGVDRFLGENQPTGRLLQQVRENNGVAVLAHPTRRGAWKVFEREWATGLCGVEIWNRKTDGWAPSPDAARVLEGTDLVPFVGLDFHDRNQLFPLAMELDLSGPITEGTVLDAVRQRRCRATAFGLPAARLANAPARTLFRSAESLRRVARAVLKVGRSQGSKPVAP